MMDTLFQYGKDILDSLPSIADEGAIYFYGAHALIFIIVLRTVSMIAVILLNKGLSLSNKRFSREGDYNSSVLILGDSTAVGTGAKRPEDTIAGRLAKDFPNTEITNLGDNGSTINELEKQLDHVAGKTYDMIIISSGGNDIWSFTSIAAMEVGLARALARAKLMSGHKVVFLLYNKLDEAPIFPRLSILRLVLKYRGKKVQKVIRKVAAAQRIPVIELFNEDEHNPFTEEPRKLFAPDGVHPSSEGYAVWYIRMWRIMTEKGFLYQEQKVID